MYNKVGPVLLYYPNGEAKNIYFLPRNWGSIEGKVHTRKGDSLYIHTTPMAKQKIKIFLPRHWGSIEGKVHTRKGDSLHIHTTPMAKQKIKIFSPRHWGSIEGKVQPLSAMPMTMCGTYKDNFII